MNRLSQSVEDLDSGARLVIPGTDGLGIGYFEYAMSDGCGGATVAYNTLRDGTGSRYSFGVPQGECVVREDEPESD